MKKEKSYAFKKDVFLLGADKDGIKYWLEAPSWDCEHYWGFGYIESYTNNNNPSEARDINSHEHADSFMSEWFIEWNGSEPRLIDKTFNEEEGWELSELFKEFYFLQDSAEYWRNGGTNILGKGLIPKKIELSEEINNIIIPKITNRIIEILTPKK